MCVYGSREWEPSELNELISLQILRSVLGQPHSEPYVALALSYPMLRCQGLHDCDTALEDREIVLGGTLVYHNSIMPHRVAEWS